MILLCKIITKQKACVIILLLFLNNTYSQDFKLAGIHYANYPKAAIKDISGNQETSFNEFGVFINFPKKLKNDITEDDQSNSVNLFGPTIIPTMTSFVDPLIKKSFQDSRCT